MKHNYSFRQTFLCLLLLVSCSLTVAGRPSREFYQLTIYYYNTDAQEKVLDQYLQQALLPALHRSGIAKAGVFKSRANDTASQKLLYVLVPFSAMDKLSKLPAQLTKDTAYQHAAAGYLNAVYTAPPYLRMETILLQAFSLAPVMQLPSLQSPKKERVYELRSYESATEKIFSNKVKMFNEGGEIALFKRLQFNAVFYAEVLAGGKMPNLMYMTSFENIAEREKHWKSFVDDPEWKKLSAMPEYQHNVSHIDIFLLYPTDYSDI